MIHRNADSARNTVSDIVGNADIHPEVLRQRVRKSGEQSGAARKIYAVLGYVSDQLRRSFIDNSLYGSAYSVYHFRDCFIYLVSGDFNRHGHTGGRAESLCDHRYF